MPAVAAAAAVPVLGPEFFDRQMPIERLRPSPLNPRKHFDRAALAELAQSVREVGVIEPIVARPAGDHYEIVAGERRFRASQLAERADVPVIVKPLTDAQALEIMVIENNQREDVNALEEADGFSRLLQAGGYTPETLAGRLGRSKKYVYDRVKLLDLAAPAKELLAQRVISAGHGILLARLKPEDQLRALDVDHGGVFESEGGLTDEEQDAAAQAEEEREDREYVERAKRRVKGDDDGFALRDVAGMKPRSVRETAHWIAEHVRFRPHAAAAAAPLEYGEVAARVDQALAKPGRGKKVIAITFDHFIQPEARDESERTYGPRAFKFADGLPHRDYGDYGSKEKVAKACEYSVLGVVAVGEKYGQAFDVCIARDKCQTHWKSEIDARAKNQKLRDSGKGKQAEKNERAADESYEARWKREAAARAAKEKAWNALCVVLVPEVVAQVKATKALAATHANHLVRQDFSFDQRELETHLGKAWFAQPVQAILLMAALPTYAGDFDDFVKHVAKPLGLDVKRLTAIRDKHQAPKEPVQTSAQKKKSAKKPAKKKR